MKVKVRFDISGSVEAFKIDGGVATLHLDLQETDELILIKGKVPSDSSPVISDLVVESHPE